MLAREKHPRSRFRSGSLPRKCLVMEKQGDFDSHVVKTSAKFKDIEIVKLFFAYNLPFSITDHDQFVKVVKMLRPGYVPRLVKLQGCDNATFVYVNVFT